MNSTTTMTAGTTGDDDKGKFKVSMVREQDRLLPIANVSRIMKKALPVSAKVAKDARETMQECVSEFISFITSEASDKCLQEKRKTINGEDILWAMSALGFDQYITPLNLYLEKYKEVRFSFLNLPGRYAEITHTYSHTHTRPVHESRERSEIKGKETKNFKRVNMYYF